MTAYAPPGWPDEVRPPGSTDWERTAVNWLLDQCPPEYRMYAGLRRHPILLARFAVLQIEASIQATRRGIAQARTGLRDLVPTPTIDAAIEMWEREQARFLRTSRSVSLIEQALCGHRFVPRIRDQAR